MELKLFIGMLFIVRISANKSWKNCELHWLNGTAHDYTVSLLLFFSRAQTSTFHPARARAASTQTVEQQLRSTVIYLTRGIAYVEFLCL